MKPKHVPKQAKQGIALVFFIALSPLMLSVLLVVLGQFLPWVLVITVLTGVCRIIVWHRHRGW